MFLYSLCSRARVAGNISQIIVNAQRIRIRIKVAFINHFMLTDQLFVLYFTDIIIIHVIIMLFIMLNFWKLIATSSEMKIELIHSLSTKNK